jgi:sugar phosphate permease
VPLGTFVFRALAKLPIRTLLCLEFLLIGLGFAGMGKASSAWPFVAAAVVNQLGCGMILPTLLTWATRGLAFEIRGRGTGVWQSTFSIGQFLSGVVVTFLGENVGGLLPALFALGIANLIAAVLAIAAQIHYRSAHAAPAR